MSNKNFEFQNVYIIGDMESFPWVELCKNSHHLVQCLCSVLIVKTLSPKGMSF